MLCWAEKQFIFGPGASKMDSWTFTVELMKASATIITALAWPAMVFGIVYLFRTGKIRAKYGKWELWLDKAEKTAERPSRTASKYDCSAYSGGATAIFRISQGVAAGSNTG
jgi:hypothetical protein